MTAERAIEVDADSEAVKCGTRAGAQRHRALKEPVCEPCREADREYMRDYRSRKGAAPDRWWNRTHNAALRLLAAEHPRRFAELLAEVRGQEPATPWDPIPDSRPA